MASYRIPSFIGRYLGSLLDSSNMFITAQLFPWAVPKRLIILQDFMLPEHNLHLFLNEIQQYIKIFPLWFLPMINYHKIQLNSIFIPKNKFNFVNVGIYGIPITKYEFISINKLLETILTKYNGRKVYYSHSFYSRNEFYNQLYNGKKYFQLRKKYFAENVFPEIFDKIITKNEIL